MRQIRRVVRSGSAGRALDALALLTAAGLLVVVWMGALVTQTGSAQGCGPDWPLCGGRLLPPPQLHALIEFGHRAVAGAVGLLSAALAAWAWRARPGRPEVRILGLVGVGFVVVQALLGAAAVRWPESPPVLALHFGFSLLALTGVALLAVVLRQLSAPAPEAPAAEDPASGGQAGGWTWRLRRAPAGLAAWAWAALAYVYALVYLGAYVAHAHAALACAGWPLCNGRLVPVLRGPVAVAFLHRVAALIAVLLVGRLAAGAASARAQRPDLARGALAALALLLAQAGSGALLVLTSASLGATLLHATLVAALFFALAYVCLQTLPEAGAATGATAAGPSAARPAHRGRRPRAGHAAVDS